MRTRTFVATVVATLLSSMMVLAPAAVAQADENVVIAAGNRGSEYNISSGSNLDASARAPAPRWLVAAGGRWRGPSSRKRR